MTWQRDGPCAGFLFHCYSHPKTAKISGFGDLFSITGFAPAEVDYSSSSLTSLTLEAGSGVDTFDVQALGPGTPVTIDTGEVNDTVNVGDTSNSLDKIQGPVTVNGASNLAFGKCLGQSGRADLNR
jgi:hypothetical protein